MRKFETLASALALCGWLVVAAPVQAQDSVGVNAAIRNSVQTRSSASGPLRPAQLRAPVRLGDQFVTGPQSQVQVLLRDRSTFTVGANARMTVDLPAPLAPSIATISPGRTSNEIAWSTGAAP